MRVIDRISSDETLFYSILSPTLLVAVCAAIQIGAGQWIGVWAWVPTMLCFWSLIAWFLRGYAHRVPIRDRLTAASGAKVWSILAVGAGLLSLPGFLSQWRLLAEPHLIFAWLTFALVNPWFEESYWRGLIIDATADWGNTASLLYSSTWFAMSHPLIWGIHSTSLRTPEAVGALFFVGLLWGLAYQRTGSLRWCIAGHVLANLLGLAALVLLNLYDPTVR